MISLYFAVMMLTVVKQAAAIDCNWEGIMTVNGNQGWDAYYLNCDSRKIVSVRQLMTDKNLASDDADITCDWDGPRGFHGTGSFDNFLFECYDDKFYGMKLNVENYVGGPWAAYGSIANGPLCNFDSPVALNGEDNHFQVNCRGGNIESLQLRSREDAVVSRVRKESKTLSSAQDTDAIFQNQTKFQDDVTTCTTWATASGSWQLIHQSNSPFTYEVTMGTTSTDEDKLSDSWAYGLQTSMSSGMKFLEAEVTSSISQEITSTVSHSFTQSYEKKTKLTCGHTEGYSTGGALYQWVISTHHVGNEVAKTNVFSDTTLCTAYEEKPKCPALTCKDTLCQECDDWEDESGSNADGFLVATCNWSGDKELKGSKKGIDDDYFFYCQDQTTMIGSTGKQAALMSDARKLSSVQSCAGCNWEGTRWFSSNGDCHDAVLECYNGFLYSITFTGKNTDPYKAGTCGRNLVSPGEKLSGTQCNWEGKFELPDVGSKHGIAVNCANGVVDDYELMVG